MICDVWLIAYCGLEFDMSFFPFYTDGMIEAGREMRM